MTILAVPFDMALLLGAVLVFGMGGIFGFLPSRAMK